MKLKLYKGIATLALASTIVLSNKTIAEAVEMPTIVEGIGDYQFITMIEATSNVYVRKYPTTESDKLGQLTIGEKVNKIYEYNGFYMVYYNNEIGYVSKSFSKEVQVPVLPPEFLKLVYISKESAPIYETTNLNREQEDLLQYEVCEVIDEFADYYYVRTDNTEGFVKKGDCNDLSNKVVVVDESDQILKFYNNNRVVMQCNVVTGKPGHETNKGYHKIIQIRKDTRLVGPGWNCHVDVFAKFDNDAEGFHDATWRDDSEFVPTTRETNGSHGCVNMKHDEAVELVNQLTVGDEVIIKR